MIEAFTILLIAVAIIYFFIIISYSIGWFKTKTFHPEINMQPTTKISVVIAARNEAENIAACIQSLQHQTYSKENFEVIVIDDHSEDNTFEIAKEIFTQTETPIAIGGKIRKLENFVSEEKNSSFKKQAIASGVELATGDLIVTLDADCVAPENWLITIAQFYETHHSKMIVMPVRFENGNAALQIFQQMDLSGLIGITAGSLYWNFPVMANGANLAYEKKIFQLVKGFEGNEQMPGGDDIMLLLKIKKQFYEGIKFLKNNSVIVTTKPVKNFQEFYHQRLRWISKSGKFGDWKITAVLILSYLFYLLSAVAFIVGLAINKQLMIIATIILFLKYCIEFYLISRVSIFLQHPFNIKKYIFSSFLHKLYAIIFGLLGIVAKYEWKGRHYK
jgi:cellulose synthase/poly-beta-1,6-N-acetylglucosamine synthase-like glycosyltransferase